MVVLAKQHIYECRSKCTYPSFTIFLNKVSYVYQLEKKLMYSSNKVANQESKWEKFQLYSAVVVRIKMPKNLYPIL